MLRYPRSYIQTSYVHVMTQGIYALRDVSKMHHVQFGRVPFCTKSGIFYKIIPAKSGDL